MIKMLPFKPGNLSSIPENHIKIEGENSFHIIVLWCQYMLCSMAAHTHILCTHIMLHGWRSRQLWGIRSVFLPCGSQELNSGLQDWHIYLPSHLTGHLNNFCFSSAEEVYKIILTTAVASGKSQSVLGLWHTPLASHQPCQTISISSFFK